MNPANHDPETTGLLPEHVRTQDHPLSEPLERLSLACEALQTWASDTASRRAKRPTMSPVEARMDRATGEQLLADVLQSAAPVIGHLSSVGGRS